ncbi:unnamed protein product [Closterium sp. NIES-65]|nr:unnamed protein product [Closterium sp. NIES-65]
MGITALTLFPHAHSLSPLLTHFPPSLAFNPPFSLPRICLLLSLLGSVPFTPLPFPSPPRHSSPSPTPTPPFPFARPPLTCLFHPLTHLVLSHSRGATLPPPPHLTTLHRTPLLQDLTPRPAASSGYKQQYPSHTSTSTLLLSLTPLCYTSPTPVPTRYASSSPLSTALYSPSTHS